MNAELRCRDFCDSPGLKCEGLTRAVEEKRCGIRAPPTSHLYYIHLWVFASVMSIC